MKTKQTQFGNLHSIYKKQFSMGVTPRFSFNSTNHILFLQKRILLKVLILNRMGNWAFHCTLEKADIEKQTECVLTE